MPIFLNLSTAPVDKQQKKENTIFSSIFLQPDNFLSYQQ